MKLKVIASDLCPKDRMYVMDCWSVGDLVAAGPSTLHAALLGTEPPDKVAVCPDDAQAERIREAARRVVGVEVVE